MPNGKVAPGWVLPTWGFGHHQVAARPWGSGRSVDDGPDEGVDVFDHVAASCFAAEFVRR